MVPNLHRPLLSLSIGASKVGLPILSGIYFRLRLGLVIGPRQCDKENHGWREGTPLVSRQVRSGDRLSPSCSNSVERKEESAHPAAMPTRSPNGISLTRKPCSLSGSFPCSCRL